MKLHCDFCDASYTRKDFYKKHLEKHKKDNTVDQKMLTKKIKEYSTNFICNNCNKCFSRNYTLNKHMEKCNQEEEAIHDIERMKEIFNKFCSPNEKEYHEFMNILDKNKDNNVIINNKNIITGDINGNDNKLTNNNIINQILLKNFNQENLNLDMLINNKKLSNHLINNVFQKSYDKALVETMCNIWCNEEYPENHNIFVNSQRGEYIKVFQDNQWKTCKATDILGTAVEQANVLMSTDFDQYTEGIEEEKLDRAADIMTDSYYENDKKIKKSAMKGFHNELYLNKDMIKATYEKTRSK